MDVDLAVCQKAIFSVVLTPAGWLQPGSKIHTSAMHHLLCQTDFFLIWTLFYHYFSPWISGKSPTNCSVLKEQDKALQKAQVKWWRQLLTAVATVLSLLTRFLSSFTDESNRSSKGGHWIRNPFTQLCWKEREIKVNKKEMPLGVIRNHVQNFPCPGAAWFTAELTK